MFVARFDRRIFYYSSKTDSSWGCVAKVTAGHCQNAVGSYEYPHCASVTRRLALDNRTYPAQLANTTHTRCRPTLSWMGGAVAEWVRAEGGRGGREVGGGREGGREAGRKEVSGGGIERERKGAWEQGRGENVKGGSIFTNQPFTNRSLPLRLWYYKWQIVNMYKLLTLYCNASECIVWQMDNMSLCDGTYDWVRMAWTRCITGNPSEAG